MKRVLVFQTSNGQLHENEMDAIMADFKIELRGVIQSDRRACFIKEDKVSLISVLDMIVDNGITVRKIITKYNQKVKGLQDRRAALTSVS